MYLQLHCGSQQSADRARNILFYALWVLYALTMATCIIDILHYWVYTVSMDHHHCCLTLFQLVAQNIEILSYLEITIVALSDVIPQFILVRPTGDCYHYWSNSSKDISLLYCLGLQHSCCNCSAILSIRIFRCINYLQCSLTGDWF